MIIPLLRLHSKRFLHSHIFCWWQSHENDSPISFHGTVKCSTLGRVPCSTLTDLPDPLGSYMNPIRGADRKTWFYHRLMSRPQIYGRDKDDPQLTLAKPVIKRRAFSNNQKVLRNLRVRSLWSQSNSVSEVCPWGIPQAPDFCWILSACWTTVLFLWAWSVTVAAETIVCLLQSDQRSVSFYASTNL